MSRCREAKDFASNQVGEIGVVMPKGGYPHIETGVVNRGAHGGAGGGTVSSGGIAAQVSGGVIEGSAVREPAAVDVVRGGVGSMSVRPECRVGCGSKQSVQHGPWTGF